MSTRFTKKFRDFSTFFITLVKPVENSQYYTV
nr:MAG TPA: hypothetical protein [Caudoviricetes sp.]